MADLLIGIKISASGSGQTVKQIREIEAAINRLGTSNRSVRTSATQIAAAYNLDPSEVSGFVAELDRLGSATAGVADRANALDQIFTGFLEGIGRAGVDLAIQSIERLGETVAATAQQALSVSAEFDAAATAVETLGVDSGELIEQLGSVSQAIGGQVSQLELLQGSYDIASSGFTDAADAAKIVEASVRGATGGFSDFATVSDALTSTLNAYGLSAAEATATVDKFIQIQNLGKITVDELAQQIGRLAPTAALAGVSLDELGGFIANATAQGLSAEATITGLRTAISNTINPSQQASEFAEELGIQFDAAALASGGLAGILQQLNERGLDSAENLTRLFGSVEAVAAIAPSAGEGFAKLQTAIDQVSGSLGASQTAFDQVAATVPELQKRIQALASDSLLQLGQALAPLQQAALSFGADLLTAVVQGVTGLDNLTEASERLAQALTSNPELVQRLGDALAQVANAGIQQLSALLDALTAFLGERQNVEALAQTISNLVTVINALGATARFVVSLTEALIKLNGSDTGLFERLIPPLRLFNEILEQTQRRVSDLARSLSGLRIGGGNRPAQSLRSGGVAQGGVVQVHQDEFLIPPRGTRVLSQAESRALVREAIAAPVPAVATPSLRAIEGRLDKLIAVVQRQPPPTIVTGGNTYNLSTERPTLDAVAIELGQIRAALIARGY